MRHRPQPQITSQRNRTDDATGEELKAEGPALTESIQDQKTAKGHPGLFTVSCRMRQPCDSHASNSASPPEDWIGL
jgi:hypothetical protein